MNAFLHDLLNGNPLLLRSIAAMALAAVACGITGTYVVLRRESYAVGAVSHSECVINGNISKRGKLFRKFRIVFLFYFCEKMSLEFLCSMH